MATGSPVRTAGSAVASPFTTSTPPRTATRSRATSRLSSAGRATMLGPEILVGSVEHRAHPGGAGPRRSLTTCRLVRTRAEDWSDFTTKPEPLCTVPSDISASTSTIAFLLAWLMAYRVERGGAGQVLLPAPGIGQLAPQFRQLGRAAALADPGAEAVGLLLGRIEGDLQ